MQNQTDSKLNNINDQISTVTNKLWQNTGLKKKAKVPMWKHCPVCWRIQPDLLY